MLHLSQNVAMIGKYIIDVDKLILCQSKAKNYELHKKYPKAIINPLGEWIDGTDVDIGATNRKLGSDMADSVTGGGLHGKDLSKADVSVLRISLDHGQHEVATDETGTVEDVVAKHHGLGKSIRTWLNGIGELEAEMAAVS